MSEFKEIMKDPLLVILDTRDPEDFAQGFIKGSVNIGLNGNFAQWVGEMISDIKQKFLLITYPGKEQEAVIRLSRVGYYYAIGYLEGGVQACCAEGNDIDTVERIGASVLMSEFHSDPII